MLEVVASYNFVDLTCIFWVAGADIDLIVLNNSLLFDNLLNDIAPIAPFEVNGVGFENGLYLADGIYPQWATFVKSFTVARDKKNALFIQRQKGARKDVERAFGVLKGLQRRKAKELRDKHIHTSLQRNLVKHAWQQDDLKRDVSNEEIKRAVWDCGTDKSPSPDGFSFGFYRRFWYLIENDVYDVVKYFYTYGVIPKGCNSSFIALIPKSPGANMVKDFRPISLIGSVYKIIAKILENRFVGVLGDIVNEVQYAFIADRQILDGPFILNEVLQWFLVLECFYRASGLRINMSKSKIMGIHVVSDKVKSVATKLGSKVGGSMSRVQAWTEVVDRVKSRLSKWKMKALSIGGRLTVTTQTRSGE
ncbi:RNA-directed DNA polymerase, eukaryota, reverse transcriptase zinc-binding domain protein [Tanacetum coccineum]